MTNAMQKRQIYDRHGEEGLKAHEGGQQHHANPFDMFQHFFNGGCTLDSVGVDACNLPCAHSTRIAADASWTFFRK